MKWYEYRQNNSGGSFCKPALNVIVQAINQDVAETLAERLGVYFDGCSSGGDCPCCGDRWYRDYNGVEDKPEPSDTFGWSKNEGLILTIYVYDNGKTVDFVGVPANMNAEKTNEIKLKLID